MAKKKSTVGILLKSGNDEIARNYRKEYRGGGIYSLFKRRGNAFVHEAAIRAPKGTSLKKLVEKLRELEEREFIDSHSRL